MENSVGRAGDAVLIAGDADEFLGLVVVGRDVGVIDRPVPAQPVAVVGLEIDLREAERHAAVVVGASADDARAEPHELGALADGVGLAFEVPVAAGGGKEAEGLSLAEVGLAAFLGAAMAEIVGPLVLQEFARGHDFGARFDQGDLHALGGEDAGGGAASGAGSDDDRVEYFGTVCLWHRIPCIAFRPWGRQP